VCVCVCVCVCVHGACEHAGEYMILGACMGVLSYHSYAPATFWAEGARMCGAARRQMQAGEQASRVGCNR